MRPQSSSAGVVRVALTLGIVVWCCGVAYFFSSASRTGNEIATLAGHAAARAKKVRAEGGEAGGEMDADDEQDDDGEGMDNCPKMRYWKPRGAEDAAFDVPYKANDGVQRYATVSPCGALRCGR